MIKATQSAGFLLVSIFMCVSAQQGESLLVERTVTLQRKSAGKPFVPLFSHGKVVIRKSTSSFQVYGQSGVLVADLAVSIPEARRITVRDVAVAPSGELAVSAGLLGDNEQFVSAILWLDANGTITRVVRTSPFAAVRLVFTPDGYLWALGRVHDSDFNTVPGHEILRQYDQNGRLCRSALPVQDVPCGRTHPMNGAFLLASESRLGLYAPAANEWIELSFSGQILSRWRTPGLPERTYAISAGFTDRDGLCLSLTQLPSSRQQPVSNPGRACRFDRVTGRFVDINLPVTDAGGQAAGVIVGAEGSHLVFYKKPGRLDFAKLRRD